MSVHVTSWVLKNSSARLGNRLVLLVLADYADDKGLSWPSIGTISREAKLSDRQARRCLRELEASGSIRREGLSTLKTFKYVIVMDKHPSLHALPSAT